MSSGTGACAVEIAPVTADDLATARAAVWTSSLSGVVAVAAVDGRTLESDSSALAWTTWISAMSLRPG